MKSILYIFTNEYPYGTGESFIENELGQHLNKFDKIYIFPLTQKGELRKIDTKIEVLYLFGNKQYQP